MICLYCLNAINNTKFVGLDACTKGK